MGIVSAPAFIASVYNGPITGIYASTSTSGRNIDKHGNLWLYSFNRLRCIDQTGTIIHTYGDTSNFADEIVAFATGTGLYNASASVFAQSFAVLRDGDETQLVFRCTFYQAYLVLYEILAVYDTLPDGTVNLVGVVWAQQNNGVLNSSKAVVIGLAGNQTFDDPTLLWIRSREIGGRAYAKSFPPINQIIGHAAPCGSVAYPIADSFYGEPKFNLGSGSFSEHGAQPAFFMPGPGGTTNAYIYIGASAMAANHAAYPGLTSCAWVETDLYPTYPQGCMVKVGLGVVGAPPLGSMPYAESAPTVDVVPGVFSDGATSYNAFTDVNTNFDGSGSHGSNDYFATPTMLRKADDGTFEVGWYHPYVIDDSYTTAGLWSVQVKVRLQSYDPETEVFTDRTVLRGPLARIADIGAPQPYEVNFIDLFEYTLFYSGGELFVWNMDEGSATGSGRYYTWLARIGRAGVSGTTHATIFPRL